MASDESENFVQGAARSRDDISVLAGGPLLLCGTSERKHVSCGGGDEGGARAGAARRGLAGQLRFFERRDSA